MTDELPTNVLEALAPTEFDVLDFIAGKGTPRDSIRIHTDDEAGYRLAEIADAEAANADLAENEGLGIADEVEWADPDEVDELKERIAQSDLIFNLRGLAPAAKKALRAHLVAVHNYKEGDVESPEAQAYFEEFSYTLISKTVESVVRGDGAVSKTAWTPEAVAKFRENINEDEYTRLDTAVYEINFNTDIYDRAVSADFLSKR